MVVKFKDVCPNDFRIPLLTELEGQTFVMKNVVFRKGKFGEYAVVDVEGKGEYRTSSEVLIDQLKRIAQHIIGEGVEAKLVKRKNYYTFE